MLHHYQEEGLSQTAIARKLGVSRRTVYRYVQSGEHAPTYGVRPRRPSPLDPYKPYLQGRLDAYPELSAVRLLGEVQALGYAGCYTVVKDFARAQRPHTALPYELRFEVAPGEQVQVDFAEFRTPFGKVHALLAVLSWSRALWVRFFLHQDQLTVLGGLHAAFVAFGGVPRTALFDRMKTAVADTEPAGTAVFNAELLRFAAHYGFRPRACRPYRAKTKGKVERGVSYLRSSFFYGRTFRDLEDLNAQCAQWLRETANTRVHGTTGEAPAARLVREQSALLPLPAASYVPLLTVGRRITRDGFISYNGNAYSVPQGLGHGEVEVRATLSELRLFQQGQLVATHPLLQGRGQRRLAPEHHRALPSELVRWPPQPERLIDVVEVQRRPLEVYEEVLR